MPTKGFGQAYSLAQDISQPSKVPKTPVFKVNGVEVIFKEAAIAAFTSYATRRRDQLVKLLTKKYQQDILPSTIEEFGPFISKICFGEGLGAEPAYCQVPREKEYRKEADRPTETRENRLYLSVNKGFSC